MLFEMVGYLSVIRYQKFYLISYVTITLVELSKLNSWLQLCIQYVRGQFVADRPRPLRKRQLFGDCKPDDSTSEQCYTCVCITTSNAWLCQHYLGSRCSCCSTTATVMIRVFFHWQLFQTLITVFQRAEVMLTEFLICPPCQHPIGTKVA